MMLKSIRYLVAATVLMGCSTVSTTTPAVAQLAPAPNILVFTEDADQDTVPRNSRVSRQVLQEVQNQFNQAGYRYFDETAIGLDYFAENRTRRPRGELLRIARAVDTPIDIAVVYMIYASVHDRDFMVEAAMRIEGEMIDVGSGQGLGSFSVEADEKFKLPISCTRECVLEEMAGKARPLGRDLGRVLVRMVNDRWVVPPQRTASLGSGATTTVATTGQAAGMPRSYSICFDDFSQNQMLDVEELLASFPDYLWHRVSATQSTRTCYQYESTSDQAKLLRNVRRLVDHLEIRSDIKNAGSSSIEVVAIPTISLHPTADHPKFE
jgi:hypothetical protein